MKLENLLGKMNMEQGFYIAIVSDKNETETFYDCADDFYESPSAKYLYEKEVMFISTKKDHLYLYLKK